jgi:hypothetical protein
VCAATGLRLGNVPELKYVMRRVLMNCLWLRHLKNLSLIARSLGTRN